MMAEEVKNIVKCSANTTSELIELGKNGTEIISNSISAAADSSSSSSTTSSQPKDEETSTEGREAESTSSCNSNSSEGLVNNSRAAVLKPASFLRPSTLLAAAPTDSNKRNLLNSPRLNLDNCKFANADSIPDSMFNSYFSNDKGSSTTSENKEQEEKVQKNQRSTTISNPNFVFGQNLHERIAPASSTSQFSSLTSEIPSSSSSSTSSSTSTLASASTLSTNGTTSSDMLFTTLSSKGQQSESKETGQSQQSLLEDAARCEEARAPKRKYEEVQVTTGEEGETNVLQMSVKLFGFEGGSWIERGRGTLRLNDRCGGGGGSGDSPPGPETSSSSRIVIRTLGSLKVVLNTKIWPGMDVSKASEKSVRLTAFDCNGVPKIFLVQASPSDITSLYQNIEIRIRRCKVEEERDKRFKSEDEVTSSNNSSSTLPQP